MHTALGVLVAVRDGLVELDAPIARYLPGFRLRSRFEERPELRITLRHLLSHTAGLTHSAPVGNAIDDVATFDDHIAGIADTWLRYPVGQRYSYANLGPDLAAHILAVQSHTPFETYLREAVLRPLGLRRTTFDVARVDADPDRAVGHDRQVPDLVFRMPMVGAGGCWTTAHDAALLLRALLDGLPSLLPPELAAELYQVPVRVPGQRGGYALGVDTVFVDGTTYRGHGGGGCGFLADLYWSPDNGCGAAVLMNCSWHGLQGQLALTLLRHERADPPRGRRAAQAPLDKPTAADHVVDPQVFVGEYIGRFATLRIARDGGDIVTQFGDARFPTVVTSRDEVAVEVPASRLRLRLMADHLAHAVVGVRGRERVVRCHAAVCISVEEAHRMAGRREDEPADACSPSCLDDLERPVDVGLPYLVPARLTRDAAEMNDGVNVARGGSGGSRRFCPRHR